MKFETKIGLGEICGYNEDAYRKPNTEGKAMPDILVKVIAVTFDLDGKVSYTVEHIGQQFGVQRFHAVECQLTGDPEFDQESGSYP